MRPLSSLSISYINMIHKAINHSTFSSLRSTKIGSITAVVAKANTNSKDRLGCEYVKISNVTYQVDTENSPDNWSALFAAKPPVESSKTWNH